MIKLALVAIALAGLTGGCKKKDAKPAATPPPVALDAAPAPLDAAAPAVDAVPPPVTPAVPAGKVGIQILDLQYGGIVTPGLPAIRADGGQFAVVVLGDDGGRGYLDLKLRLIDGTTAKVGQEWVLADPDKTNDGETESGDMSPAVLDAARAAVATANTALAAAEWRPLTPVTLPPDAERDREVASTITAGDVKFTYLKGTLTIAKPGAAPLTRTYQQLTGQKPPAPVKADDDEPCHYESEFLDSVAVDATAKRALVAFDFHTGHNCGGAGAVYGVVTLP